MQKAPFYEKGTGVSVANSSSIIKEIRSLNVVKGTNSSILVKMIVLDREEITFPMMMKRR